MKSLSTYRFGRLGMSLLLAMFLLVSVVMALAAGPTRAAGPDCTVKSSGGDYTAIQPAINDAGCATITVDPGTYNENLTINRSLTLQGAGQTSTIIDGSSGTRVITITGASTEARLYSMRITGGNATSAPVSRFGGGILVTDGATLRGENLQIDGNIANTAAGTGFGGGLAVRNGSAYLTNTLVYSNVAKPVGSNNGVGQGGGLYAAGDLGTGRAILSLVNSQVLSNTAHNTTGGDGKGGGLFVGDSPDTQITLNGNTWQGNIARKSATGTDEGSGGAIAVEYPGPVAPNPPVTATLTIMYDTFTGNIANASNDPLGINALGTDARGGAIFLNTGQTQGRIDATLKYVTMMNNVAKAGSSLTGEGRGGAIHARHSRVVMSKSKLYENKAALAGDGYGGGIYTRESEENLFQLTNSFLAGNTALGTGGDGAAIYIGSNQATTAVSFVTIADDELNPKTAIYYDNTPADDRLLLGNTIVASHTTGINNAANPLNVPIAYVLFFNNTNDGGLSEYLDGGGIINSSDNQDPRFVNPAGNDYHIQSGSGAIDKGIDDTITTDDIDGDIRPQGAGFDIGADEAAAKLSISKSGPSVVALGAPITYTLTVQNNGSLTATNLLVTDTIPSGATHHSGGTLVGNEVQWNVPSLGPGGTFSDTFSVIASQDTIVNDDYRVSADGNISATGTVAVQTSASAKIYLPVVIKQ